MIQLEPIIHRDVLCIAFRGKLGTAYPLISDLPERKYSATHNCYYIPHSALRLQEIIKYLNGVCDVDTSSWCEKTFLPRDPGILKPWIVVPPLYRETLTKMRYSDATITNYMAQFSLFLGFIYPNAAESISDANIHRYLLYLSEERHVAIATEPGHKFD